MCNIKLIHHLTYNLAISKNIPKCIYIALYYVASYTQIPLQYNAMHSTGIEIQNLFISLLSSTCRETTKMYAPALALL